MTQHSTKPRAVIATNCVTGEITTYSSMNKAARDLDVNPGQVRMCCIGNNHTKTAISKNNKQKYKFKYDNNIKGSGTPLMSTGQNSLHNCLRSLISIIKLNWEKY